MSIAAKSLREHVIEPTLEYLGVESTPTAQLLLGTANQESGLEPLLDSVDGLGIYQITPQQHRSVWDHFLAFEPDLASKIRGLASQHRFLQAPDQELESNLAYATAIAWSIYQQAGIETGDNADFDSLACAWQTTFHANQSAQPSPGFAAWLRENDAIPAA